jgi:signal transduction histidine kinase
VFTVGSVVLFFVARSDFGVRRPVAQSVIAQIFDTTVVIGFTMVFAYDRGLPTQQLLYINLAAACVRFRIRGGLIIAAISAPIIALFEQLRSEYLNVPYSWELVVLQTSVELVLALLLGWLVREVAAGSARAEARAVEAEDLRDELGRRADLADAANRCARALTSSLDVPQAFGAFIRELRGLLPFDRVAIILAEDGVAKVMATAGAGVETVFPPGSGQPLEGTLLDVVMTSQTPVYRRRLDGTEFPEERDFEALGLHSRLAAPLLAGTRPIGMLSLLRREPDGFTQAEIELVGMLGRLVASTAQNLRVYEAERRTVEELRRLSALRADFVSLVSHEVRTPMAAVIGSARTLRQRWRDLNPDQRDAFLALIADETDRLAALVGEVLDSSRIDAGTFSYSFVELDLAPLIRETVAAFEVVHADSTIQAEIPARFPPVRGDPVRLRQVLTNLLDNAVKYSPDGSPVEVRATMPNGDVRIAVVDHGGGIAPEDQRLIFEKFGRVHGTSFRPGSGLGLFIAKAIAEAHVGTLEVSSTPGKGSTFTLTLPLSDGAEPA